MVLSSLSAEPRENEVMEGKRKKKSVGWAAEEQLSQYFYFDLNKTERGEQPFK